MMMNMEVDDDDNVNYEGNDEKYPEGNVPPTPGGEKEQQSEFSCNHCGTEFIGGVKLKRQNDPFCGPQMVTQVV